MRKSACLLLALAALAAADNKKGARQPKLFFVTSSTSTSISTTTSTIGATFTCYIFSATDYTACTGRRKKRAVSLIDEQSSELEVGVPDISVSRVERSLDDQLSNGLQAGVESSPSNDREAKFAWYYMTTTVTSVSTSTSTSTSFTATASILLQSCTPTSFNACG